MTNLRNAEWRVKSSFFLFLQETLVVRLSLFFSFCRSGNVMPLRLAKAEGSGKERDSFGLDFRVVGAIILPPRGPLPGLASNELQGGVVQLSPLHSRHRAHSLIIPVFSLRGGQREVSVAPPQPVRCKVTQRAAPSQMVSDCSGEAAEGGRITGKTLPC